MLIVCPSCASEYALDPARIGPQGRSVRCARCRTAWFVTPAPAAEAGAAEPEAPALDAEARSGRSPADPATPPLAARRRGRRAGRPPGGRMAALAGRLRRLGAVAALALVAALAAALVLGRAGVVRALPAAAGLYERIGLAVNLRGLEFRGLGAELSGGAAPGPGAESSGQASLVIEGEIANVAGRPVPVPPVEIVVREGAGAPPLYTWTALPDQDRLGPGEATRFRARLVEPPPAGREVAVRFASPQARAAMAARLP